MHRWTTLLAVALFATFASAMPAHAFGGHVANLSFDESAGFYPPSAVCDAVANVPHTLTITGRDFQPGRGYSLVYDGHFATRVKADATGTFTGVLVNKSARPTGDYRLDVVHDGHIAAFGFVVSDAISCVQVTGPSGGIHTWTWNVEGAPAHIGIDFFVQSPTDGLAGLAHKRTNDDGEAKIVFQAACPGGATGPSLGMIRYRFDGHHTDSFSLGTFNC